MVRQDIYEQVMEEDWRDDYRETLSLSCNAANISLTLRFPIPDMRPAEQRTWWAPALRADYVIFHLEHFSGQYKTQDAEWTLEFAKLNCEYLENSDAEPISFLLASPIDEDPLTRPRVTVKTRLVEESPLLLVAPHSPSPPPSLDNILHIPSSEPSPFSNKRVMYESQQMVMPGSKKEMGEFEEDVTKKSQISVNCNIPQVLVYLQDKEFFEVLYNRLLADLCLWTPGCPTVQQRGVRAPAPEVFRMCTSTAYRDTDSEEEEEEEEEDMALHRRRAKAASWLSLSFDIHQARVSLNCTVPPGPEESPLHRNPVGEILVELIDSHLFTVVEHRGDPDTSFFSMYSETGTLLHGNSPAPSPLSDSMASTITGESEHTPLTEILFMLPENLATDLPPPNKEHGFLSLATKVFFDQAKNVKEITLAVALQNVCHKYLMTTPAENYAPQLIEFFNVQDYAIPGYKLPLSVTSLHTHLYNLAVDYQPLHLPWYPVATIQYLSVTSNLALDSSLTSLRIMLEDLSVYLAPRNSDLIIGKDYVKLIELDLFELAIKMLLTPHHKSPQLEVEIKNNMLHIGTCSDSLAALRDVLLYCTTEGDLHAPEMSVSPTAGDCPPPDQQLPTRATRVREHSSSDDVPSLVKSAVGGGNVPEEEVRSQLSLSMREEQPPLPHIYSKQTFTFPDDSPTSRRVEDLAQASREDQQAPFLTGHSSYQPSEQIAVLTAALEDQDEDDKFFVVESELVETMVAKGQFVVKKLVEGKVRLVEDHFTLPTDTDQLKAPPHFPLPLSRITIKELSLQWNMYGGLDFPDYQPAPTGPPGTPRSERSSEDRSTPSNLDMGRNKSELMEFQVSKMKLRFEQYPLDTPQIFRLCLILTDIEIRDKMGSSNFNKFLYQYSTEDNPRPSRTPMITLKVVHSRTEERAQEDAIVRVSVLPLRFNIDQDALLFMFNFFNTFSDIPPYRRSRVTPPPPAPRTTIPSPPTRQLLLDQSFSLGKSSAVVGKSTACAVMERSTAITAPPLHMTSSAPSLTSSASLGPPSASLGPPSLTSPQHFSTGGSSGSTLGGEQELEQGEEESCPAFIKAFVFSHDVPIRIDYKGKNIRGDKNLISNPVTNLLIGLAQLNCSELRLRSLCYRQGILGYSKLCEWALTQWINDIKSSQLSSILGGVGPMHSFIQLFSGVVDLVYLPVQQYREDGRIVRGLQRGANSFTHSTAVSLLQLTTKLFTSIQCVAEVTYDLVSPAQIRRDALHHPADLREGLVNAYQVVTSDITTRASSIQHAAVFNHATKGITSAIGGVLRELPPTLLLPFITLPKVITQLSTGAQNHLKPSTIKEREEKYRTQ